MTGRNNSDYTYYGDLGSGYDFSASLPTQTLPLANKTPKWQKGVMDRLETIGIRQIYDNRVFADYRKMYEGRLIYQDFDEQGTTSKIAEEGLKDVLPTYLKHFDIIGIIINQLAGEYDKQRDTIRVDSIDAFSDAEYFRDKDNQLREYTENFFKLEVERKLIQKGLNPNKDDFKTEEEKQQYMQQLQAEQDKLLSPEKLERKLKKSFKVTIAEWAEKTIEANYIKFDMADMDMSELVDYLSTGRYFRSYHVGYDHYKPETWSVERTFFSQDINLVYPQDAEYVGRIEFMSGSQVIERYGHYLPEKITKKLYGYEYTSEAPDSVGFMEYFERGGSPTMVPDKDHFQRQAAHAVQQALDVPMGKQYFFDDDGDIKAQTNWLRTNQGNTFFGAARVNDYFRDDINGRSDVIQVTEAYWKSQRRMGLLTMPNPYTNMPMQEFVTEDIYKGIIEEYDITQIRSKSLQDATDNPENFTIAWFWVPEVWKGYKMNATNTEIGQDYYFGIGPLEQQIKGDSNLFDVKIPVAGIITSGIGQKIRPYQIEYNIVMNQIRSLLEKELGIFFMMDYAFLPSQYKGEGGETSAELVEDFRDTIKEFGFNFFDTSPQNSRGANPNQNQIQRFDITFTAQIQQKIQLAQFYQQKAYEQIGITQQRIGNPNEYETAEGVKQGVSASYAQTERIYKRFNTAKRKEKEIELAIAQYAVKDNKDITVSYTNPDGERILNKFTDDKFWLRKINIIPVNDSKKRKDLEDFRRMLVENNTMGNDLLDIATVFTTDSFVSIMELARNNRIEQQKDLQETRAHEQQMLDKKLQAAAAEKQAERQTDAQQAQLDRDSEEFQTRIRVLGDMADSNLDPQYIEKIRNEADRLKQQTDKDTKTLELKAQDVEVKNKIADQQVFSGLQKAQIEAAKLKLRKQEMQSKEYIATINKN